MTERSGRRDPARSNRSRWKPLIGIRPPWHWGNLDPDERDFLEATLDLFVTDYNAHLALKPDHLIPACWRLHPYMGQVLPVLFFAWVNSHRTATAASATPCTSTCTTCRLPGPPRRLPRPAGTVLPQRRPPRPRVRHGGNPAIHQRHWRVTRRPPAARPEIACTRCRLVPASLGSPASAGNGSHRVSSEPRPPTARSDVAGVLPAVNPRLTTSAEQGFRRLAWMGPLTIHTRAGTGVPATVPATELQQRPRRRSTTSPSGPPKPVFRAAHRSHRWPAVIDGNVRFMRSPLIDVGA